MLKSSVLKIIQSFSPKEITEFSDFLKSPFFNKKSGVVKLYNEIKKYYPDFIDENLGNEQLWSKLYPGKKYGYGVMKNLIFELKLLVEQFISAHVYGKNNLHNSLNILKFYNERNLNSLLETKFEQMKKQFDNDKRIVDSQFSTTTEYLSNLSGMYHIKLWNSQFNDQHRSLDDVIEKYQLTFFTNFFIQLISNGYFIYLLSFNDKSNDGDRNLITKFFECIPEKIMFEILEKLKSESNVKFSLLCCYYLAHKATVNPGDASHFRKFKEFLKSNFKFLPASSIIDMDALRINTISLNTDPSMNRQDEMLEAFDFKLMNNIILDRNGLINGGLFLTWVTYFFSKNKCNELDEFIHTFGKFVDDDEKVSAIEFAKAVSLLLKSRFDESISVITKTKFNNLMLKNSLKKMHMIVCYEKNDFEMFYSSLDAYKHFLSYFKMNIPDQKIFIERSRKFCMNIDKLFKIRENKKISEINYFRAGLNNIDLKPWFERKIAELVDD
ncbi:MAG TPA: hypothetical protein PKC91_08830 [Ignavibacteria bacterium]|nr:hypothetical protein [Ignavibacteria bacterium]